MTPDAQVPSHLAGGGDRTDTTATRERQEMDYEDVTNCPICPQLATDRDDALTNLDAVWATLLAVADWVCAIGYPMDFSTDVLPPEEFRPLVEEAWVRYESAEGGEVAMVRETVAEEGRWLDPALRRG